MYIYLYIYIYIYKYIYLLIYLYMYLLIVQVRGSTSLCIAPGFDFALCDGLLTNFHAPDSTLLMITAAAAGGAHRLRHAYSYAVQERFRFLSYGDVCFFLRK